MEGKYWQKEREGKKTRVPEFERHKWKILSFCVPEEEK